MAVSTRTRFEVFKRDGFTCQYCGRQTPQVILEADHVVPRVEGGGDELENLITACQDCNRGKGGIPLDVTAPMLDMEAQAELLQERERQLRAYNEAKREQRDRSQAELVDAWNYWFEAWDATSLPKSHCPWESTLKRYIELLGVEEVKSAIDITRDRFDRLVAGTPAYFGGVLKRKLALREGRLVPCTVCGGFIELTPDEAGQGGKWHHTGCESAPEPESIPDTAPTSEPERRSTFTDRHFDLLNHPAAAELIDLSIKIYEESWKENAECAWLGYEREIKPRLDAAIAETGLDRDALVQYCTEVMYCGCVRCLGETDDDPSSS
jgi:hypothetical protein